LKCNCFTILKFSRAGQGIGVSKTRAIGTSNLEAFALRIYYNSLRESQLQVEVPLNFNSTLEETL
jgi:hypothetical protein